MTHCQGNNTQNLQEEQSNNQVSSIVFANSENIFIDECQFNGTYGFADLAVYADFPNMNNAIIQNTQFNNSRGGPLAGILSGVRIGLRNSLQETQANGLKFINCQFNGTTVDATAPVSDPAYFSINCGVLFQTIQNVSFENCQACNIRTDNPNYSSFGYFVVVDLEHGLPPFLNVQNVSFTNCVASDVSTLGKHAAGFFSGALNAHLNQQGQLVNVVMDNCIAERISSSSDIHTVAGFADGLYQAEGSESESFYSAINNLCIKNCRASDVRSTANPLPSFLSAGIVAQSVIRPVLINNSVSDCDRGILLTGTNQIIPNGFQLAATLEDALAFPPISIPLTVSVKVFTNPELPGAPFDAVLADYSPTLIPTTGLGAITTPLNACGTVVNDLTNQIGICRRGACIFPEKTANIETQGGVGTIVIQNPGEAPFAMSGAPTGNYPSVMISFEDGTTLMDAINDGQAIELTIDSIPTSLAVQTFVNLNKANEVLVTPVDVDSKGFNFIYSPVDLNSLNWQSGDPIFYDCQGGDALPDLVCSTTYYAIVYSPGFARNGVIQDNEVDNCSESGYQDDAPTTSSAWINNFAFNNGTPASAPTNYSITWAGTAPVYAGDLAEYPTGSAKTYNISLTP